MFEVREKTARQLFGAQQPQLQGRLRLDVSSRCLPADPEQPLDLLCARVAIGERVVQLAYGCAADAIGVTDRQGFAADAVPPPPDSAGLLSLMPDPDHFESFVCYRLDRLLGLDRQGRYYACALSSLADDFYTWGQTNEAQKADFVVDTGKGRLFIRCKSASPDLPALEPADEFWPSSTEH